MSIRTFAPTIVYISFTFLSFSLEGKRRKERARAREKTKKRKRNPRPPIFRSPVYNRDHPISVIAVYDEEPPLIPSYPRWPGDEKPRGRWTGLAVSSGFHSIKGERVTFSLSSRSRVSSRREERRWRRRKGGYAAAETRPSVRARFPAARES